MIDQRIVIADDDVTSRLLLEHALRDWGYDVAVSNDGAEAWKLLGRDDAPRLAILDWMMPEIDGPELCRRIKARTDVPYTYTILLTSKSETEDVVAGLEAGADDFLSKPVNPHELKSRLEAGRRFLQYESALSEKNEQLHTLINAMPDLVCFKDGSGRILEINNSFLDILGLDVRSCLGKTCAQLADLAANYKSNLTSHDQSDEEAWNEGVMTSCEEVYSSTLQGVRTYSVFRVPLVHGDGARKGLVYLARDVSDRKALEERLREEATYDALTGLANRKHFLSCLHTAVAAASRYNHPLSLCVCDIDKFKEVNDTHGHSMGDKVLTQFAEAIRNAIRIPDVPGRFGGDEFCVIFPDTPTEGAEIAVERIRKDISNRQFYVEGGETFRVTASFGVASMTRADLTVKEFFEEADRALYEAKRLGRDRVHLAGPTEKGVGRISEV